MPVGASQYVPLAPSRLVETRVAHGGPIGYQRLDSRRILVDVAGRVPAGATAVVLTVTIVNPAGPGFVTLYPAGTARPTAANANAVGPGAVVANMAHVKLGNGKFELYHHMPTDIVVDLLGAYVGVSAAVSDGRFIPLSGGAQRAIDSRDRGYGLAPRGTETIDVGTVGVPAQASAVVVTITAVDAPPGFVSAYPSGLATRPTISTLNLDGFPQTRAGQAIVQLDTPARTFALYSHGGGHFVVDVVGWFTGAASPQSTTGLFLPSAPLRQLDTRLLRVLPAWGGSTYEINVGAPLPVAAAVINLTATEPWNVGFVTAYPAGQARPTVSNLNLSAVPLTIANHAIVGVSTRGVALYTQNGAHLIADVSGWYLGNPSSAPYPTPASPNYQPNRAIHLSAPRMGAWVGIGTGSNLNTVADQGYAATWSDTVNVASPGNMMLFAHRTEHGAPFYWLHLMRVGDPFSILGSDGHWYHYVTVDTRVTLPWYSSVATSSVGRGPITAQLIACSKSNGLPTSLSYRLVVTGRLYAVT